MSLAFFASEPYMHSIKHRLMRGSSLIRARQIAEYLGAKYNPVSGYEDDVCIYVKPKIKPSDEMLSRSYVDVIDDRVYIQWLRKNPRMSGIIASQYSYNFLKEILKLPNKILFIPQQHCNFERFFRNRKEIINVGISGTPNAFQYPIEEVRKKMENIGLRLLTNFDFQTREDVVDFYKNVDIQIVWDTKDRFFKNPLKIINAASFGIPTIGFPQKGYQEVEGHYIQVGSIDQLIDETEKLKNPELYERATRGLLQMAESYHISKIAEMYKQLDFVSRPVRDAVAKSG